MTREESISLALERKAKELNKKISEHEGRLADYAASCPEYAKISRFLSEKGARLALTALGGDADKINALKEELTALSLKKSQMLKAAGIGEIEYDCKECEDTGYKDGAVCDCIKESAKKIMLESLDKAAPFSKCTFSSFNLVYYSDAAAQKRMSAILALAKEYAFNFDPEKSGNLLFMGNTGLGKTHLSLSIAGEAVNKGYSVIYGSAYNLFSEMESEHFSLHTNKKYDETVSCDLLVIDDLGGEFVSPYIQSLVYNILNTRLLSGKPTVINTNLSMKDIENRYTPRVASRLIGEYTAKMFLGSDVRQIKAAL